MAGVIFELGAIDYEWDYEQSGDQITKSIYETISGEPRRLIGQVFRNRSGRWTRSDDGSASVPFALIADVAEGKALPGHAGSVTPEVGKAAMAGCEHCTEQVSVRPSAGARAARCTSGHWTIIGVTPSGKAVVIDSYGPNNDDD